jgi:hypothetical protein
MINIYSNYTMIMKINVMFSKLLYLYLIITKKKNYLIYNFLQKKCNYKISNVISWLIKFSKFV